jgi:hypothetical protein
MNIAVLILQTTCYFFLLENKARVAALFTVELTGTELAHQTRAAVARGIS